MRRWGGGKLAYAGAGLFEPLFQPPPPPPQGCIGREGTSEAVPEAVRQAVGGGKRLGAITISYNCR